VKKKDKTCLTKTLFLASNFIFLHESNDKSFFMERLCAPMAYEDVHLICSFEILNILKYIKDAFQSKESIYIQ
jgi:hypothetical protein